MLLVRKWRYNRATPEARVVMLARWAHQLVEREHNFQGQGSGACVVGGLELVSKGELGTASNGRMVLVQNTLIYHEGQKVLSAEVHNYLDSQAALTEEVALHPNSTVKPGVWVDALMQAVEKPAPKRRAFSWWRP